ncbi:MAG: GDP-6-deoxy-D-lyxo-4-hexulose reductase [Oceanospirillum sp.]|nr:GDP-6-deoxy-D-lyxo-4-hexulose reductase [Oceanospirillum sp.]
MTSLLLTGSTGFVGERFCERIAQAGSACSGVTQLSRFNGSVLDEDNVRRQIEALQPDVILHLAALSHVPTCLEQPEKAWAVNTTGTLMLLQACVKYSPATTFIYVGSSDCYGASFKTLQPITEASLLQPLNPYAASKAAADLMVGQYGMSGGLKTIRLRPFNHTGSHQRQDFVVPSFAAQIAAIEAGLQPAVIKVGNLDAERDFLDVDDVISAYFAVIRQLESIDSGSVFNIASGQPRSIRSILDELLKLGTETIQVELDPTRLRPSDIPTVQADSRRLQQMTGWRAEIPWSETLKGILAQQRQRLARKSD